MNSHKLFIQKGSKNALLAQDHFFYIYYFIIYFALLLGRYTDRETDMLVITVFHKSGDRILRYLATNLNH